MWNNVMTLIILPLSFYIGSRWGTGGIAGVWVVVYPLVSLPLYWRLFRRIQMRIGEYLAALWPAINGCIIMAVTVGAFKHFSNLAGPLYLRFASEIAVGALSYALALSLMHRQRVVAFLRLAKSLRGYPTSLHT
jgi:uncharacterized membrane protein